MKINASTIFVNGMEMFYLSCGNGPPLILLHGGLGTAQLQWKDYLLELSEKFTVYALDTRGHGKSTNPDNLWSYKLFSKDLNEFIKKLNIKDPVICGWSDGAQIGLEHALNYPGVTSHYILAGVFIEQNDQYYNSLRSFGLTENGVINIEKLKGVFGNMYDLFKTAHSSQGDNYIEELASNLSVLFFTPLTYTKKELSTIEAKILIVIGDRDQFISVEHATKMYNEIKLSYLAIAPNTDHTTLTSKRKNWFIKEIINFTEV